jgi:hypothetical protein
MDTLAKVFHDTVGVFTGTAGDNGSTHDEALAEERRRQAAEKEERRKRGEEAGEKEREEKKLAGVQKGDWILLTGIFPNLCVAGPVADRVGWGNYRSVRIRRRPRPLGLARCRLQRQMHGDIGGGGGQHPEASAAADRAPLLCGRHGRRRAWRVR